MIKIRLRVTPDIDEGLVKPLKFCIKLTGCVVGAVVASLLAAVVVITVEVFFCLLGSIL